MTHASPLGWLVWEPGPAARTFGPFRSRASAERAVDTLSRLRAWDHYGGAPGLRELEPDDRPDRPARDLCLRCGVVAGGAASALCGDAHEWGG